MDFYNYVIHPETKNKIPIYTKLGKELVLKFIESRNDFKGGSSKKPDVYIRGAAGNMQVKKSKTIQNFVTRTKKISESGDWKKVPNKKGKTKKYGHKKWEYNGEYKLDDDRVIYNFKRKQGYKKGDKVFIINKNDGSVKDYSGILYTHECGKNGDDVCIDNQLTIITNELRKIYNKEMSARKRTERALQKQAKINANLKKKSDKAKANWGKISNTIKATAVLNKGKGYFSKFTEHIFPADELTIPAKMEIYNNDITALHKDTKYEQIKKDDEWHLIDSTGSIHPHDTSIHPGKHSLLYWAHQAGFYGPEYFNEINTYVFLPKIPKDTLLLKDALEMSEEKLKAWINKRKLKKAVKKSQAVAAFNQAGEKKQAEDASKAESAKEGRNKLKKGLNKLRAVQALNSAGEENRIDVEANHLMREGTSKRWGEPANNIKAADGSDGDGKCYPNFLFQRFYQDEDGNWLSKDSEKDYIDAWKKSPLCAKNRIYKNRNECRSKHYFRETDNTWENWDNSKNCNSPKSNLDITIGEQKRWRDNKCYSKNAFDRFYENPFTYEIDKSFAEKDWKKSPKCSDKRNIPGMVGGATIKKSKSCGEQKVFKEKFGEEWIDKWNSEIALDCNEDTTSTALVVTGDGNKSDTSTGTITDGNVSVINSTESKINKSTINTPNINVMPTIPVSTRCTNLNSDEFKNLSKLNNTPFPKSDTTNYSKLPIPDLKKNIIIFGLNAVKEDGQNECYLAKHNYLMAVKIWGILITKDPSYCANGWEKKMSGYANRYYELGV